MLNREFFEKDVSIDDLMYNHFKQSSINQIKTFVLHNSGPNLCVVELHRHNPEFYCDVFLTVLDRIFSDFEYKNCFITFTGSTVKILVDRRIDNDDYDSINTFGFALWIDKSISDKVMSYNFCV